MSKTAIARLAQLSAEDRSALAQRALELAKKETLDDGSDLEVLQIVSGGQLFALPLVAVGGVTELASIAPLPRTPEFVRGLVSFRGEVLLAVELSGLMGASPTGFADLRRVVCLIAGRKKLAVVAEKNMTVRGVAAATFSPDAGSRTPFVSGVDTQFVSMIDVSQLIAHVFSSVGRRG